nr:MAG TPA: hypothetical protein [Caudoviricetes sp.]
MLWCSRSQYPSLISFTSSCKNFHVPLLFPSILITLSVFDYTISFLFCQLLFCFFRIIFYKKKRKCIDTHCTYGNMFIQTE